eukprot:sb/3468355/
MLRQLTAAEVLISAVLPFPSSSCPVWRRHTPFDPTVSSDGVGGARQLLVCLPNCGGPCVEITLTSDTFLRNVSTATVGPRFSDPRFSDKINFPRYRKLTLFDPDLVATPIYCHDTQSVHSALLKAPRSGSLLSGQCSDHSSCVIGSGQCSDRLAYACPSGSHKLIVIPGRQTRIYTHLNFLGSNMTEANDNFVNWIIKKVGINESSRLLEIGTRYLGHVNGFSQSGPGPVFPDSVCSCSALSLENQMGYGAAIQIKTGYHLVF